MILIALCLAILFSLGVYEKRCNERYVKSIPIRVNVNGIRGKSTVTRLITSVISEAGYETIGKTTGTEARIIFPKTNEEEPIVRRREGANISEQLRIIKRAAKLKVEALVCECMAVNPDYQKVFQSKMIQANIGVIVNVLEDHLDVMGPTLDQIADAFTETIPYNGYLITIEGPYTEYFKTVAESRNTKVIVADNSKIKQSYLNKFDYVVFPDNVSLALAVGEALGIDNEVAFKGMLKANPDPGALRISKIGNDFHNNYFANGFAANDAASTLRIWERIIELGYSTDNAVIVMNCREDRVDRTEQFARDVLPYTKAKAIISIGKSTAPITKAFKDGQLLAQEYLDLEECRTEEIIGKLEGYLKDCLIYGIGNIHGAAELFIEGLFELNNIYEDDALQEIVCEKFS